MNRRIACRLLIEGRVQGVGFRNALCAEALRLDVGGWVRNHHDGRVEAFLYGEQARVNVLITWAHHGPNPARVDRVTCQEMPFPASPEDRPQEYFPFRRKPSL